MMRRLALTALLLSLALGGLWGCGASVQSPPARAGFEAYLSTLRGADPKPAYKMLTREQRQATSYESWVTMWSESELERKLQADELEKSLRTHGALAEEARLRFEDGKVVTLTRGEEGWRLHQALVSRTQASSPDDALTIFAASIANRNVEGLLRVLSKRRRQDIEEQLARFQASLEVQLEDPTHEIYLVNPDRAEMTWISDGIRNKLVIVKEDGDWYLDDVHLGPDPLTEAPEIEAKPKSDFLDPTKR